MNDHIVLCGLGKVGYSILELLYELEESVAVVSREIRPDWRRRAETMAARLIVDDARSETTLRRAGVDCARAIIAATDDDLANLEIALDARRMAPDIAVVVRLYDETLADRVRRDLGARAVLNSAALSAPAFVAAALGENVLRAFEVEGAAVNVVALDVQGAATGLGERLGALAERLDVVPLAVKAATGRHEMAPSLDNTLEAGDEVIVAASREALSRLQHGGEAPEGLAHRHSERGAPRHAWVRPRVLPWEIWRQIWAQSAPALRFTFLALVILAALGSVVFHYGMGLSWLNSLYFCVTIITTVGFGDLNLLHAPTGVKLFGILLMLSGAGLIIILLSIVTNYLVTRRFEQVLGKPRTTLSDHVIIVGLGNIGHRVARRLHQLGEPVIAIEQQADSPFAELLPVEIPVLVGNAEQGQMLDQAGIERARTVLAVTDDDQANLHVAHHAERLNPGIRTVVRLFRSSLAQKLGTSMLAIDQALNPSHTAAATFTACALVPNVLQGFTMARRLFVLRWGQPARVPAFAGLTVGQVLEREGILIVLRGEGRSGQLRSARLKDIVSATDRIVVMEEYQPKAHSSSAVALAVIDEPVNAEWEGSRR